MKKQRRKLNEFIEHAIDCESYGNITKDEVVTLLRKLYDDISKKIKSSPYILSKAAYKEILDDIEQLLKQYKQTVTGIYETNISDISEYQSSWLKNFMKELGKNYSVPAYLMSSLKFSPIAQSTNYEGVVDESVYKIRHFAESSLRTAYMTQEETSSVSARFEAKESKMEKNIIADTKLLNATIFSSVNYLMYRANKQKVVYCAILDSKTCIECASKNGIEYNSAEAPMGTQHHNCRCTLIPVEALEDEQMPESFEEWFETLSDDEKKQVVGASRYKLYAIGIPVTQFVDNQYKLIPLKSLKNPIGNE